MSSTARPAWLPPEWGDWGFPDPKAVEEEFERNFPYEKRRTAWVDAAKAVQGYHDQLVEKWQGDMDSLLTYAGLFSAVLTAFNAQSYQLLQSAPADPMLAVLQQISTQLNSFSVNPSFINSTQPARSLDQLQTPFRAPVSAIWINILWFASLVCSLTSASIALMVKQWLYEESLGLSKSGTSRETARLRQYRLNSLIKWKVGTIVRIPSVLLQVALFLFLAGLLILLWTIHETVAAVITVLVGALFLFVAIVNILPVFRSDCCYRSPQAFGIHAVVKMFWNWLIQVATASVESLWNILEKRSERLMSTGRSASGPASTSPASGGNSTVRWFGDFIKACHNLGPKILRVSTWSGAEQTQIAQGNGAVLDRHIATTAYTSMFAVRHPKALPVLLSDLPCDQVFSCFFYICRSWNRLWGPDDIGKRSDRLRGMLCEQPFYYALRKLLTVKPDERGHARGSHWAKLSPRYLLSSFDAYKHLPRSGEFLSVLALTSIGDDTIAENARKLLCLAISGLSEPFSVTYSALRDVMALARYNIENWGEPNGEALKQKLEIVRVSLKCTQWALVGDSGLSSQQAAWIRGETRSLLSSLMAHQMVPVATDSADALYLELASLVVEPLTKACRAIPRGYELVPEGWQFLSAAQRVSLPDEPSRPEAHWQGRDREAQSRRLVGQRLNRAFDELEQVIDQQRHEEEQRHEEGQ